MSDHDRFQSSPHSIPEAERFSVREQEFSLDLLESSYAFRDIANRIGADGNHRDYLVAVVAWVKGKTGVELQLTEADYLSTQLDILYAQKKRQQGEALRVVFEPTSPNGTASTPTD
jgi:hypothetical protein